VAQFHHLIKISASRTSRGWRWSPELRQIAP
jgi:hypothetical protein